MENAWAYHVFQQTSVRCTSIEDCLLIIERAMSSSKMLIRLETIQATTRRKNDTLRELKSGIIRQVIRTPVPPRLTGKGMRKILTLFKHEFVAVEMDSRHAFASAGQIVAAIKPKALLLPDSSESSRLRHQMFVEKVSCEPRVFFARAGVESADEALNKIVLGFRKEMLHYSISDGDDDDDNKLMNSKVFGDINLSDRIIGYLDWTDVLLLAACGSSLIGCRERGQLAWGMMLLKRAFRKGRRDYPWMENILMRHLTSSDELELREYVSAQRAAANCIQRLYSFYFPHDPLKESPLVLTSYYNVVVQNNHKPLELSVGGRINTASGLFVVRKSNFPETSSNRA